MTVFRPDQIPFSYAGSWFGLSRVVGAHTTAGDVHLVSHRIGMHPVFRLTPVTGSVPAAATVSATPAVLTWRHDDGTVEAAYDGPDTLRLRGRGLGLAVQAAGPELTPFSGPYLLRDPMDGSYVVTRYETGCRYRITVLGGDVTEDAGVQALGIAARHVVLGSREPWEIAIEEFRSARKPYRPRTSFDRVTADARATFTAFADAVAPWRDQRTPAAEAAAYVLWSATVAPAGFVTRPAVLMSKHWMDKVWSWDHCFNALALADGAPGLAWDQFHLVFDHQDPATGALPDSITHSEVLYNFVKPPVHGWALRRLRARAAPADLASTYRRLADWTTFWLDHRRAPGSLLPHYQHGNDSGWDNATVFDAERVVESPDLAAFLVLQLRELAAMAPAVADFAGAARWIALAGELRGALMTRLWTGEEFSARGVASGRHSTGDSLLHLMPIVLGEDLPSEVTERLARGIRRHLTPYGLATELPASPHYEADGYWRGPVWAPSTVLIEDGLRRAGHTTLAEQISASFRAVCESSGFAENFEALTGEGQRDRAYTWTASSYLLLAADHQRRHGDHRAR